MATITLGGNPIETFRNFTSSGNSSKDFNLVKEDLSMLPGFSRKRVVLIIFPSIDTGVCATSTRKFNAEV